MERTYPPEWLVALVIVAFGAKAERLTDDDARAGSTGTGRAKAATGGNPRGRRRDVRPPRAC